MDFIGAYNEGGGGVNCSYKTCKTSVILSPPTNQQPALMPMTIFTMAM